MILSVESIPKDLKKVKLRTGDGRECLLAGMTADEAVVQGAELSEESFAIRCDGDIVAYWGFGSGTLMGGICRAWLLTCPGIEKYQFKFTRTSVRIITFLLERFNEVRVVVDPDYTKAVSWLRWLGFEEFDRDVPLMEMRVTRETMLWGH